MRLRTTRSDKMKRHYQQRRFLFVLFSAFVFAAAVYLWVDAAANLSSAAGNLNIKKLNSNIDHRQASNIAEEQSTNNSIVHPASDENVVAFLMNLALKSPSELWTMFGKEENLDDNASYGDDPFLLKYLENGKCPWKDSTNIASDESADKTTTVEWLPSRPIHSETIAEKFRTKSRTTDQKQQMAAAMRRRNNINQEFDSSNEAILWYEHLSKAGGTSFCELVKLNMPKEKVPRYHCMPSKGKLMDGRVGSWSNKELMEYVSEGPHRIVSSEWEPFSLEKLKLAGRKIRYDTATDDDLSQGQQQLPFEPHVLFLTTLRDPSDRLLSAYTFFGITATKNQNAPPFPEWIKNNVNRVHMYQIGTRSGYRSNTARHNHIVCFVEYNSLSRCLFSFHTHI